MWKLHKTDHFRCCRRRRHRRRCFCCCRLFICFGKHHVMQESYTHQILNAIKSPISLFVCVSLSFSLSFCMRDSFFFLHLVLVLNLPRECKILKEKRIIHKCSLYRHEPNPWKLTCISYKSIVSFVGTNIYYIFICAFLLLSIYSMLSMSLDFFMIASQHTFSMFFFSLLFFFISNIFCQRLMETSVVTLKSQRMWKIKTKELRE